MKPSIFSLLLAIAGATGIVFLAMWVTYTDYELVGIKHPEVYVALLGISYLGHILLRLTLYKSKDKDVKAFLRFTRMVILIVSIVPILKHVEVPSQVTIQQAAILTAEVAGPISILYFIEGLIVVFCFIILKKKPRTPRINKGKPDGKPKVPRSEKNKPGSEK